jgi:gliding motility-associated-like protein
VDIVDENGCEWEDSLQIKVIPKITADFTFEKAYDCFEGPVIQFTNQSENASIFNWDFGDGSNSEELDVEHQFEESDSLKTYQVKLTSGESFCSEHKTESISTVTPFVPNFISPNGDGKNDYFHIVGIESHRNSELVVLNRWGEEVFRAAPYINNWDGVTQNGNELPEDTYYYVLMIKEEDVRKGFIMILR